MSQGCSLWPWVLEQWTLSHHWFVNGVNMSQGSCKCKYDTFCRWGPERDVAFQRLWVWNGSIIRALWDLCRFSIFTYLLLSTDSNCLLSWHTRTYIYILYICLCMHCFSIYVYYLRKIDMHIQVYEILLYNHKLPINCWVFLHLISLFGTEIKAAWVDHSAFSCFAVLGLETSLGLLNRFILRMPTPDTLQAIKKSGNCSRMFCMFKTHILATAGHDHDPCDPCTWVWPDIRLWWFAAVIAQHL